MIKQLQKKGHKKPLLTGYVSSFDPDNDPQGRVQDPWRMVFDRFIPEGAVFFLPETIPGWQDLTEPVTSRFYSAHFCFTLGEFSVDCIEYNDKGFYSGDDKYVINDLLEQYRTRTTYFNKNLSFIQGLAFPIIPIPRNRKIKFLSLIYNNIIKKIIPFIDENILNYSIKGCYPLLSNEKFEDCPITAIEPPYINLMLECNHKLSIEAYKGIIFSKYDNSESIRCPYCRNDLKLKFYK
jgi:hypothetical protein